MEPELADDLVLLRKWSTEDADWYARESKDQAIQRFTADPPTLTEADVVRAIEGVDPSRTLALLITDVRSGARLGTIAVQLTDGIGDVSYWVAAGARGRGVATAAIRLVADWLLGTGRVAELRLWTHEANTASQRAATAAGFGRDPGRDGPREVKGATWSTAAFTRVQ